MVIQAEHPDQVGEVLAKEIDRVVVVLMEGLLLPILVPPIV